MDWFWVGLGAGLGGIARYWCSGTVARLIGEAFPWGTLVVNVVGSLAVGVFAALTATSGPLASEPAARQLLIVGLCGGYTTFSSFSLQTLNLSRGGEWLSAAANVLGSVAMCYLAAWLGLMVGAKFGLAD